MRQKRTIKGVSILLMATILLISTVCPVTTLAEEETPTLTVGYIDYNGFINETDNGEYTGYAVEYLNKISEYTGFRYEFVYGSWPDLMKKLENGDIDLLCNAQYTEERAKIYDYSQFPLGYTQGFLYTLPNNKDLAFEEFEKFDGITVGAVKDSATTPLFLEYEKKNNFSCKIIEYNTEAEMISALKKGKTKAMLSENMASLSGYFLLAEYSAGPYYIISYKGFPYMDQIDDAMQEIKTNVGFETEIYKKYYGDTAASNALRLTAKEQAYIDENNTINVGLMTSRPPFSSYDSSTGKFTGINFDVMESIASRTGLKFNYVPMDTAKTAPQLFETGNYDVICGLDRQNYVTSKAFVPTTSYMTSSIVPVGRTNEDIDLTDKLTVAVPRSFLSLRKKLKTSYPNMKVIGYDSNEDCIDAVNTGDADIFIQNTHLIGQLLQRPKYSDLEILPVEIMQEDSTLVMERNRNPVLLSILNKSIETLDDTMLNSSLIEHTFGTQYRYKISDYWAKLWLPISIISFLLAICFALIIRATNIRKRSEADLQIRNTLLSEAVVQAEQANKTKGQFLSQMSHEIRTPMNAIVGLTTIAREHENEPEVIDDYLGKIDTSSKMLLNIINDVLDMSSIEGGKLKLENECFDLKQVLIGISTMYYLQCKEKGIEFEMQTDVENELLIGDSLRVNQILLNLVSNAYKFTGRGGKITVSVKETAQKERTTFIHITVKDTGCGMSEEMQQRLFLPFEQESAGTAKSYGGSGLGLSITKHLVDMMHGAIQAESKKDIGTIFTVELPFEIAEQNIVNNQYELTSIRALCVDDDKAALEYSSIVLHRLGIAFDVATSGEEALEMLNKASSENKPYNFCLIDWKMNGMDGIELTKEIREKEGNNALIIIISAYDRNEVEDEAIIAGANHFIPKPLFQSTLCNVLMQQTGGIVKKQERTTKKFDFSGHRLLLAEDHELNAEIAIDLLSMVNMQVDHAWNGQEAVNMFAAATPGTYDLILMDVQMPIMDGYEATKNIRALNVPKAKDIPIFAMTANAFTEDVSAALSAGMNGHIAKPIETNLLYSTIDKVVHGAR